MKKEAPYTLSPPDVVKKVEPLLNKAKLQLMGIKKSTFTTSLLFNLKIRWTEDIPTANVDLECLHINPQFWQSLDNPTRVFILAHEAWHIAFDHITRFRELPEYSDDPSQNKADFRIYNEAADHVINNMLKNKGYSVPDNACCNPKYVNMSTEQVYYDLLKEKSNDPNFIPDFTPIGGDSSDGSPKPSKQEIEQAKAKVEEMLVKAHVADEMENGKEGAEDVPDSINKRIEDLIDPKIVWYELLRNYMFEHSKNDYSYKKPNRRYMPDIIVPSLYSESMGKISVGIDVSGSIGEEEYQIFRSEAQEIIEDLDPESMELVQWHHGIAAVDVIERGSDINDVEFKESGGTDVHPLLRHWVRNPPEIAIIFTDGFFNKFNAPETIDFPVIWVIYDNDNFEADFGRVVPYDLDHAKANQKS
ncbi:metallopeptidase [Alteromonas phage vB_AemP_PT15-A5]|nr:metallopeptidase [Alteromonas phage vB_AemP_PT15-A5]